MSARRWLPALGITLVAAGFTWLNRGERIVVDVGLFRFYRAPLTVVVFLAFLAGMLSMLLLSLRHDRRVRDELRRRGLLDVPPPAQPARPAASAWGVAREEHDRTVAQLRYEADRAVPRSHDGQGSGVHSHHGEHAVAHPREDERTVAYPHEDERTAAYPTYEEDHGTPSHDGDGPLARSRDGDHSAARPREDDRTISYPRYDEDPAA